MVPTSVTRATFWMTAPVSSAGSSVVSSAAGSSVLVSSVVSVAAGSVVVVSAGVSFFEAQATMPRTITTARSRARIFFMFVPPNCILFPRNFR